MTEAEYDMHVDRMAHYMCAMVSTMKAMGSSPTLEYVEDYESLEVAWMALRRERAARYGAFREQVE